MLQRGAFEEQIKDVNILVTDLTKNWMQQFNCNSMEMCQLVVVATSNKMFN